MPMGHFCPRLMMVDAHIVHECVPEVQLDRSRTLVSLRSDRDADRLRLRIPPELSGQTDGREGSALPSKGDKRLMTAVASSVHRWVPEIRVEDFKGDPF